MPGLQTTCWGPPAWFFLHSVSFSYPDNPTNKEKNDMLAFFSSLGKVLPCPHCRTNYESNIRKLPITAGVLASKRNLTKWLYDFHNLVNSDISASSPAPSFQEVQNEYQDILAGENGVCGANTCSGNKKCKLEIVEKESFQSNAGSSRDDNVAKMWGVLVVLLFFLWVYGYFNNTANSSTSGALPVMRTRYGQRRKRPKRANWS